MAERMNRREMAVAVPGERDAAPSSAEKRAVSKTSNVYTMAIKRPASERRYVAKARMDERTGSGRSWKKPMKSADETPSNSQPARRTSIVPASATN
jgi:hypothetical protein